jgi:hypothetical protein
MSFSSAAAEGQERFTREAERHIVPHPPVAESDGFPVPALVGGIVLAFAVGIAGGQVHRRRRTTHRRIVASGRPGPVVTPPARPAPEPPAAETRPEPRPVDLAPAAPPAPAPAPPEAEVPAEQPVDLSGPSRPLPAPPPPPEPALPPAERAREPLRLVQRTAPRPAVDTPLGETPEVPRLEEPPAEEPAIPLESAPETVLTPANATPAPAREPELAPEPVRRFARPAPWPEEATELWTCEIAWKAGYRKSSFRAMAGPPGADKRQPIGDSPSVRWSLMGEPEPPTAELAIRVRALVQALEAAGWEHIGRGRLWYAQRFVWRGSDEPRPVDVPDVEPAGR